MSPNSGTQPQSGHTEISISRINNQVRRFGSNSYVAGNEGDNKVIVQPGSYTVIFDEANNPNWQLTTGVTSYSICAPLSPRKHSNFKNPHSSQNTFTKR